MSSISRMTMTLPPRGPEREKLDSSKRARTEDVPATAVPEAKLSASGAPKPSISTSILLAYDGMSPAPPAAGDAEARYKAPMSRYEDAANHPSKLWATITVNGRIKARIYETGVFATPNGLPFPREAVDADGAEARARILTEYYGGVLLRTRPKEETDPEWTPVGEASPLDAVLDQLTAMNEQEPGKSDEISSAEPGSVISEDLLRKALTTPSGRS